jgi:hypothetical protein
MVWSGEASHQIISYKQPSACRHWHRYSRLAREHIEYYKHPNGVRHRTWTSQANNLSELIVMKWITVRFTILIKRYIYTSEWNRMASTARCNINRHYANRQHTHTQSTHLFQNFMATLIAVKCNFIKTICSIVPSSWSIAFTFPRFRLKMKTFLLSNWLQRNADILLVKFVLATNWKYRRPSCNFVAANKRTFSFKQNCSSQTITTTATVYNILDGKMSNFSENCLQRTWTFLVNAKHRRMWRRSPCICFVCCYLWPFC